MTDVSSNGGAAGIQLPKIRYTTQIPDSARGRGRPGGSENPYQKLMIDMPAPAAGKGKGAPIQFASFFVPCEVPDTITDPAEREKAAKDGMRQADQPVHERVTPYPQELGCHARLHVPQGTRP